MAYTILERRREPVQKLKPRQNLLIIKKKIIIVKQTRSDNNNYGFLITKK
jgi:hypothetical protein